MVFFLCIHVVQQCFVDACHMSIFFEDFVPIRIYICKVGFLKLHPYTFHEYIEKCIVITLERQLYIISSTHHMFGWRPQFLISGNHTCWGTTFRVWKSLRLRQSGLLGSKSFLLFDNKQIGVESVYTPFTPFWKIFFAKVHHKHCLLNSCTRICALWI